MACSGAGGLDNSKTKELILPEIKNYSKAEQIKLADELKNNDVPVSRIFIKDYHKMQQETRIAKNSLENN